MGKNENPFGLPLPYSRVYSPFEFYILYLFSVGVSKGPLSPG